jgi:hypothetical protein
MKSCGERFSKITFLSKEQVEPFSPVFVALENRALTRLSDCKATLILFTGASKCSIFSA